MRIERFDPVDDSSAIAACYEVYAASRPVDDPQGPMMSAGTFRSWLARGWTCWPREAWLVTDGDQGEVLAWYFMDLPDTDNKHRCLIFATVAADRRRSGIGTALLSHAVARAREHGRTHISVGAKIGSPGDTFARHAGARPVLEEARHQLNMESLSLERLGELREQSARSAGGYALLSWAGPIPEEHIDQVATVSAAVSDAPREEGDEEYQWDAQRIRDANERIISQRLRYYTVAAQHEATGKLAGLTQAAIAPEDRDWANQELTVVAERYRGHRLGMLLKTVLLKWLVEQEPQLGRIVTWTANANIHMNAINEELGFQRLDSWAMFSLKISE